MKVNEKKATDTSQQHIQRRYLVNYFYFFFTPFGHTQIYTSFFLHFINISI